jgi:hypothetical protein
MEDSTGSRRTVLATDSTTRAVVHIVSTTIMEQDQGNNNNNHHPTELCDFLGPHQQEACDSILQDICTGDLLEDWSVGSYRAGGCYPLSVLQLSSENENEFRVEVLPRHTTMEQYDEYGSPYIPQVPFPSVPLDYWHFENGMTSRDAHGLGRVTQAYWHMDEGDLLMAVFLPDFGLDPTATVEPPEESESVHLLGVQFGVYTYRTPNANDFIIVFARHEWPGLGLVPVFRPVQSDVKQSFCPNVDEDRCIMVGEYFLGW